MVVAGLRCPRERKTLSFSQTPGEQKVGAGLEEGVQGGWGCWALTQALMGRGWPGLALLGPSPWPLATRGPGGPGLQPLGEGC